MELATGVVPSRPYGATTGGSRAPALPDRLTVARRDPGVPQ